jgi:hypothetical protein
LGRRYSGRVHSFVLVETEVFRALLKVCDVIMENFQLCDLHAHGGLHDVQPLRSAGERPLFKQQAGKVPDLTKFHGKNGIATKRRNLAHQALAWPYRLDRDLLDNRKSKRYAVKVLGHGIRQPLNPPS